MVTLALIRDTFREALARKIFWVLVGLSTLMILFFLFLMQIDIVAGGMVMVGGFGGNTRTVEAAQLGALPFSWTISLMKSMTNKHGWVMTTPRFQ